ncbi:MAG: tetratricopeptide repeat protein, partial [Parasphingopyxis sp.]
EWLGAALLLGIAGYAWQGSPAMEGSPTVNQRALPAEGTTDLDEDLTDLPAGQASQHWGVMADALNRRGNHQGAAQAIRNALDAEPNNPDLWVGLGNALLLHGEGRMNPAANLAFERAARLDPTHPGPPFFFGLALAQAGRLDEAEQTWSDLLARTPEDAPYRADLALRLADVRRALGMPAEGGGQVEETAAEQELESPLP